MESLNVSDQIFTTVSRGRTHIAVGKDYLSSVNSYNNFITKFFAKIFSKSMIVDFDGSRRSVNKKSYRKLLNSLSNEYVSRGNLSNHTNFSTFLLNKKIPTGKFMRNAISSCTRELLYHKLATAISSGDTDKAIKMIGKGAPLDMPYYDREGLAPSFFEDSDNYQWKNFHVCYAPPIIQADQKNNHKVVEMLKQYGANQNATGKTYTYTGKTSNYMRENDLLSNHLNLDVHVNANYNTKTHKYEFSPVPEITSRSDLPRKNLQMMQKKLTKVIQQLNADQIKKDKTPKINRDIDFESIHHDFNLNLNASYNPKTHKFDFSTVSEVTSRADVSKKDIQKIQHKIEELLMQFNTDQVAAGKTSKINRNIEQVSNNLEFDIHINANYNPLSKNHDLDIHINADYNPLNALRKNHKIVKLSKAA